MLRFSKFFCVFSTLSEHLEVSPYRILFYTIFETFKEKHDLIIILPYENSSVDKNKLTLLKDSLFRYE